jgi:hypothetical protein
MLYVTRKFRDMRSLGPKIERGETECMVVSFRNSFRKKEK